MLTRRCNCPFDAVFRVPSKATASDTRRMAEEAARTTKNKKPSPPPSRLEAPSSEEAAEQIPVTLLLKPLVVSVSYFPVATDVQMKRACAGEQAAAMAWRSVENLCKDRRFTDAVYVASLGWDATSGVFRVQLRASSEDVAREICMEDGAHAVYGGDPTRKAQWRTTHDDHGVHAEGAALVTDLVLLECRTPRQSNK